MPEEENPDKLTLVLEPEAAAFYCQTVMTVQNRALFCRVMAPFESNNYLVVDIGGGTVDIVAYQHKTNPQPHIEVLHEPTGGAWGGTKVNLEFKKFLESLTEDGFTRYVDTECEVTNATSQADLNTTVTEVFESQKIIFGNKLLREDGKVAIQLCSSFINEYKDDLVKKIAEMETEEVSIRSSGDIRIGYSKMKTFFQPVVDGIIMCLSRVLDKVPGIDTIYLVGGFGGCKFIYFTLSEHFGKIYKFITPIEGERAVVKGAALLRKNPEFLKARLVDATYGVRASIPFEEEIHEQQYRIPAKCEGQKDMCSNIFATFVERGDVVDSINVYMKSFTPERPNQQLMYVQIYSSSEKDVWYTTGKRPSHSRVSTPTDVHKIGELVISLDNTDSSSIEEKTVDVIFDFSTAEIKVSGIHRKSQTDVRVVLDFLES